MSAWGVPKRLQMPRGNHLLNVPLLLRSLHLLLAVAAHDVAHDATQ